MAEDQTPEEVQEAAAENPAPVAETAAVTGAAQARPEPEEVLEPKERRRRARATRAAGEPARPERTSQERHSERIDQRRRKAQERRAGRAKVKAKAPASSAEATPPREHVAGVQKVRQGVVISDKADKTITVRIDTARRHRRYDKIVRTSRNLHAHDETNDANVGDTVIVREARPLSRTKRWRLIEVLERAK